MGTKLNKETYKELIKEDMENVEKYFPEYSLEKKHILEVLKCSIECYYPSKGKKQPNTESKLNIACVIVCTRSDCDKPKHDDSIYCLGHDYERKMQGY